jgi:hypothetical protein
VGLAIYHFSTTPKISLDGAYSLSPGEEGSLEELTRIYVDPMLAAEEDPSQARGGLFVEALIHDVAPDPHMFGEAHT